MPAQEQVTMGWMVIEGTKVEVLFEIGSWAIDDGISGGGSVAGTDDAGWESGQRW